MRRELQHEMQDFRPDAIDIRILAALQDDGSLAQAYLARQVGLSPPPCLARVRMLEEAG
jgi:Lrp/AsnC family leucine-responsive transcriptional regulator